jgi:hypothetical protein
MLKKYLVIAHYASDVHSEVTVMARDNEDAVMRAVLFEATFVSDMRKNGLLYEFVEVMEVK